ncbi:MAG: hypothetical protein HOP04_01240 [Methylophilaceae bacterium]|nr:hypothetical protein [Methylophilaceae bacterium]
MTHNREQEALSAYLNFLQSKGASKASLELRQAFLQDLLPVIAETFGRDLLYRNKLEALLESKERATWPFCLSVAREFFLFWTQDIKAIAALAADNGLDLELAQWQPMESNLQTLWASLDKVTFDTAEMWPLKAYAQALRQHAANNALIETRLKLVKLLVMRLRASTHKNQNIYRTAVDQLIPMFEKKETRHLFSAVTHEFYYFWIGDPNAADFVLSKNPIKGIV